MQAMAVKAKELRFAVELTATEELREENGIALKTAAEWSPEHLVLAALIRCSLQSLRYHAKRDGFVVGAASGTARTLVTKRPGDVRYSMVETHLELSVAIDLDPGRAAELSDLLEFAERDCFIGASLVHEPHTQWIVNGVPVGE
jgi:organic hydroperoxide reductase OsmC/OhrA